MAIKTLPPRSLLRELLDYSPVSGEFTWRPRPREMFRTEHSFRLWNTRYAGKIAGNLAPAGHRVVAVAHIQYRSHRLVWLYVHGEPVPDVIDHIDGDRLNNRFTNLRAATKSENSANMRIRSSNTTGIKGVGALPNGRFRARIMVNFKQVHLGRFDTLEEAAKARFDAAVRLHGAFAKH